MAFFCFLLSEVSSTIKEVKAGYKANGPISTQSSINSRIINGSSPNCDQLNHVLCGFLYIAHWLPKPIATVQELLIYQHILDLFAPPWTVLLMALMHDLNFKLSDRVPSWQNCTCRGGTVLFATHSIDTVGIECTQDRPQFQEFAYDDDLLPSKW